MSDNQVRLLLSDEDEHTEWFRFRNVNIHHVLVKKTNWCYTLPFTFSCFAFSTTGKKAL